MAAVLQVSVVSGRNTGHQHLQGNVLICRWTAEPACIRMGNGGKLIV